MKQKEKSDEEKVKEELEEKIERLQKQNEAETIAFTKILNGLNKLANNKNKSKQN